MTAQLPSNDGALFPPLKKVLGSPLQFQTYKNLLYLTIMFPLGTVYFSIIMFGFFTGVPLLAIGIGLPIVLFLFGVVVELAILERHLVDTLLNVDIPTPDPDTDGSRWERAKRLVTASQTWKGVAYLLSEFVYGTIAFGVLASGITTSASFLLAPLYYQRAPVSAYWPLPSADFTLDILFGWDSLLVGLTATFRLGFWEIETLFGALLVSALGVILLWMSVLIGTVAAGLWAGYARRMLTTQRYWRAPWE